MNKKRRAVNAMIDARWNDEIKFRAFSDNDREVYKMQLREYVNSL